MFDRLINSKSKISTGFFYAGILFELLVSFTGYLIGGYHENLIILAGMVMFSISILFDMDLKRDWLVFIVLGAYAFACYYFQHAAFILRITLALLAGRKQDVRNVFKIFFYGTLAGMLYFGALSLLGLHNYVYIDDTFRSVTERRYTFGFYHPNGYSLFVFRVAMMGMFVYIEKMTGIAYILYSVLFTIAMIPAKSKIGIFVIVVGFVLFGIGRFISSKLANILSILSTIGVALLLLYIKFQDAICNEYLFDLWMFVDKVTTGRSGDSYGAMKNNSLTVFGVGLGPETSEMGLVDSLYCQGALFMIIFALVCILLYIKMIKENNTKAVVIIAVTIMYSVAESFLQYFNKNMIWLLCIGALGTWYAGDKFRKISGSETGDKPRKISGGENR